MSTVLGMYTVMILMNLSHKYFCLQKIISDIIFKVLVCKLNFNQPRVINLISELNIFLDVILFFIMACFSPSIILSSINDGKTASAIWNSIKICCIYYNNKILYTIS